MSHHLLNIGRNTILRQTAPHSGVVVVRLGVEVSEGVGQKEFYVGDLNLDFDDHFLSILVLYLCARTVVTI